MLDSPDSGAEPQRSLRLLVKGFAGFDLRLLDGVVKLSKRRNPSLELVGDTMSSMVDVVLLDGRDTRAMAWARKRQDWLAAQVVVWVDSPRRTLPAGHTALQRPVQWSNLPIILSRAIDDAAHAEHHPAAAQDAADTQMAQHMDAPPNAAAFAAVAGSAPAILVVDDSAAVRGHLDFALKAVGYDVTCVDSGEAAIMAVSARAYACILMDVLMPGIDGYEACRRIKSMPVMHGAARPAIVMLTSKSSPFDRIRGKMAGCDAYLTKPVQKSHLMQVLAKYSFKGMAIQG